MNILLFLIPVSIVLMGLAIWAFVWAVRRGQFDDLDTPAIDILREDAHDRRVQPKAPSSDSDAAGTGAVADIGTAADVASLRNNAPPTDPRRD